MENGRKCEVCEKPTHNECGGCHKVVYCSKEHQTLHWKTHKDICRPFTITTNEHIGRHLVASYALQDGNVIFYEFPLMIGPSLDSPPVCVGCLNILDMENCTPCEKCELPVCNKPCQYSCNHVPECSYIAQRGGLTALKGFVNPDILYKYIWALRCLYQKKFAPAMWEKINKLEYRDEELKKNEAYETAKEAAVTIFFDLFRLGDEFSVDEVMKLWGILTVYGQEIPMASPVPSGIYELCPIMEHSCRANCYKSIAMDGFLQITAGTAIRKGERLSLCHTYHFWTTAMRQRYLYDTKFIRCKCLRCTDVTEFGTNFSALKCGNEECDGVVLPKSFDDKVSPWVCSKCGFQMQRDCVDKIVADAEKDFALAKPDSVEAYTTYLEKHQKKLPKTHAYIINVKVSLVCLIGRVGDGPLERVSDDDLKLKVDVCREILEILLIIAPAEKRFKVDVLTHLQKALAEVCRRREGDPSFNSLETMSIMKERKAILYETEEYLRFDIDRDCDQLCRNAKKQLKID